MSWFSRSFSLNERSREDEQQDAKGEEEEETEEEEEGDGLDLAAIASATGRGVKEDLSQLTKSFTRQLWGVASFLAPPPPEQASDAEAASTSHEEELVSRRSLTIDESAVSSSSRDYVELGESKVLTESDRALDSKQSSAPSQGESLVASSPRSPGGDADIAPSTSRGGPRLSGFRSDFAELRGSVATGLSRISNSVIRVVAGDNSGDDESATPKRHSSQDDAHRTRESDDDDDASGLSSGGFDSLLKPLLGSMLATESSHSDEEDEEAGNKSQGKRNTKSSASDSLPSAFASGIDELSKFLRQIVQDDEEDDKEEELEEHVAAVRISDAVVTFARNIAMHPETWLDFPLPEDENGDEFVMNDAQEAHTAALERAAPGLKALRIELCPSYMSEGRFWLNYFVLLHSRLTPDEAGLLSTSQVLTARASLLKELQKRGGQSSDPQNGKEYASTESLLGADKLNAGQRQTSVPSETDDDKETAVHKQKATVQVTSETQSKEDSKELTAERHVESGRFSMPNPEDDEAEVDEWLDDDPSTNSTSAPSAGKQAYLSNLDEDVSFSDFEDEDSIPKAASRKGASAGISTNIKSQSGLSPSLQDKESGSESKGLDRRNSDKGDSDDWLTVDQEDAVSASSSP